MKAGIVVGSAPCYREDLDRAIAAYPDAFVVTVNGACVAVEEAHAILSGHTENAERYAKSRREQFPDRSFEVWANCRLKHLKQYKADYPSVTRWFGIGMSTGATSAAKAARMLLSLDYEPVILCGCPLDASGYFDGEQSKNSIRHNCRRVGDPTQNNHRTILNYRDKFRKLAAGEFKGRVFSMSGLTRDLLGLPPGVE